MASVTSVCKLQLYNHCRSHLCAGIVSLSRVDHFNLCTKLQMNEVEVGRVRPVNFKVKAVPSCSCS